MHRAAFSRKAPMRFDQCEMRDNGKLGQRKTQPPTSRNLSRRQTVGQTYPQKTAKARKECPQRFQAKTSDRRMTGHAPKANAQPSASVQSIKKSAPAVFFRCTRGLRRCFCPQYPQNAYAPAAARHLMRASRKSPARRTSAKRESSSSVLSAPILIRSVQSASRSVRPNARRTGLAVL